MLSDGHVRLVLAPVVMVMLTAGAGVGVATSQTAVLTPVADTTVWNRDGFRWQKVNSGAETSLDLHQENNGKINAVAYIRFDLSSLDIATIESATLTLSRIRPNPVDPGIGSSRSSGDGNWVGDRINIFGLDAVEGNTAQDWGESELTFEQTGKEYTESTADNVSQPFDSARVTDFADLNTIGENNSEAGTDTSVLAGQALVAWLEKRVADGGLVTFMVDTAESSVGIYSKEGASQAGLAVAPVLAIEFAPGPPPAVKEPE